MLYVDDILIAGSIIVEIEKIKQEFTTRYEMKDLGELKYYLGMYVKRTEDFITGLSILVQIYLMQWEYWRDSAKHQFLEHARHCSEFLSICAVLLTEESNSVARI